MQPFNKFVGIDWTGAKGVRHAGLAVALCTDGMGSPDLVDPPSGHNRWSRAELSDWLSARIGRRKGERVLVGIDSSFGMPFMDEGRYFPVAGAPTDVAHLWHTVRTLCGRDIDFYGGPFVDLHSDHYLRVGHRGTRYRRRMRVAENLAVASGAGPCESVFHLIGPSQVGLSGLSTMAMLHELNDADHIAIWPFDDPTSAPVVVVEIYAAAFAALGSHRGKVRDRAALTSILQAFGIEKEPRIGMAFDDHKADAILTAAALRHIAPERKYWNPPELSAMVRRTEGWIFGIV
ncbi:hypothetical protein [Kordiimonas aestuarii]|uniref:hypothetical protein n=1 Tax=Kordiimonas aestuarii TaxID=1005925 RepID=UPI0021CFD043|nr:hypothetical protein [Kordiimonas aestuarii]